MPTVRYNKLVRDRIPEIIEKTGKTSAVSVLPEPDYLDMLDIGEVERIRQEKAAERGGFEKRLLLIEVQSEDE